MAITLKEQLSTVYKLLKEPKVFKFLLSQRHSGYLIDQGWFNAYKKNRPIGINNEPLPWMTYSFIDFINERLNKDLTLFEFGSGNSTLFFAERIKKVTAIEHNPEWYKTVKDKIPSNVEIHLKDNKDDYLTVIKSSEKADMIIVDGEYRNECIYNSPDGLSERGIIILDDSERDDYNEGKAYLVKEGFRKIDFWGFSPGLFYKKATTIYYKSDNCLNI